MSKRKSSVRKESVSKKTKSSSVEIFSYRTVDDLVKMFKPPVLGEIAYYLDPSAVLQQLAKSRFRISFLERQALETMERIPDTMIAGLRYEAKMVRKSLKNLSVDEKIDCLEKDLYVREDRVWTERLRERVLSLLKREDKNTLSLVQKERIKKLVPSVVEIIPPGVHSQVEMLLSNDICEAEVLPEALSQEALDLQMNQAEFNARRPRYKGSLLLALHQRGELTNESGKAVDIFLDMCVGTWQEREKEILDRVMLLTRPKILPPTPLLPPLPPVSIPGLPATVMRLASIKQSPLVVPPPVVQVMAIQPPAAVEFFHCVVISMARDMRVRSGVGFFSDRAKVDTVLKVPGGTMTVLEWYRKMNTKWNDLFPNYKHVLFGHYQHRDIKTLQGLATAPAFNPLWWKVLTGEVSWPSGDLPLWSIKQLTAPERCEQSMYPYRYYNVHDCARQRRELIFCLCAKGYPQFTQNIYCYMQAQYESLLNPEIISNRTLGDPGLIMSLSPEVWSEAGKRTFGLYSIALFHRTSEGIENVLGRAACAKNLYIAVDVKHTVRITITLFLPAMVREVIQWADVIPIERVSGPGALSGRERWAGNQVIWRISPLPNFSTGSVLWVNVFSPVKNCWICSRPFELVRFEDRVGEIRQLQIRHRPSSGLEREAFFGTTQTLTHWGQNVSDEIVAETDLMRLWKIGDEIGWHSPVYNLFFKVKDLPTIGPMVERHRQLVKNNIIHVNSSNCL